MQVCCEICGERLEMEQTLHCIRLRGQLTYPILRVDGARSDAAVRWLCGPCEQGAQDHRGVERGIVEGRIDGEPAAAPTGRKRQATARRFLPAFGALALLVALGLGIQWGLASRPGPPSLKRGGPSAARAHPRPPVRSAQRPSAGPGGAPRLEVRLSGTATGAFQPVDVKVRVSGETRTGSSASVLLTMRAAGAPPITLPLEQSAQPGVWSGRFTPLVQGKYTGHVVARHGGRLTTARTPALRVGPSSLLGLTRLDSNSARVLRYSGGSTFFPIGVRLAEDALRPGVDWPAEIRRFRSYGTNYLEVPVRWPGTRPDAARDDARLAVDTLLRAAEQRGSPVIQMRLEGPPGLTDEGAAAYREQLVRWVRHWSYSPIVAAWHLAGAGADLSPGTRAELVRAVRDADPYRHLVAVPGEPGGSAAGADLVVMPWNGEPGSGPPALMEGTDPAAGAAPAGEDSWKLLAHGGLGLSLWPYEPGTAGGTAVLQRMKSLEEVASDIPFHRRPVRVPGVKSDGFFYRYGRMMVGWAAPDASGNLSLPPLGRARRRVRVWDPVQSQPVVELLLAGNDQHVRVPHGLGRVFVEIDAA